MVTVGVLRQGFTCNQRCQRSLNCSGVIYTRRSSHLAYIIDEKIYHNISVNINISGNGHTESSDIRVKPRSWQIAGCFTVGPTCVPFAARAMRLLHIPIYKLNSPIQNVSISTSELHKADGRRLRYFWFIFHEQVPKRRSTVFVEILSNHDTSENVQLSLLNMLHRAKTSHFGTGKFSYVLNLCIQYVILRGYLSNSAKGWSRDKILA